MIECFFVQADRGFLQGLKEYQDRVQLNDEVAEEVMREAARTKLERCLTTALDAVKKRTRVRDYSPAIQVLFPCITPSSFSLGLC